jgi:CDGSH-type Zn-finger protein
MTLAMKERTRPVRSVRRMPQPMLCSRVAAACCRCGASVARPGCELLT